MSSEPYLFALFPSVDINYAASFVSNAESVSERSGYLSDIRNSLIAIPDGLSIPVSPTNVFFKNSLSIFIKTSVFLFVKFFYNRSA